MKSCRGSSALSARECRPLLREVPGERELDARGTAGHAETTRGPGRTALSARQAFAMATKEGAQAIRMEDQIGSLSPGMRADILVVDLDLANTIPCYDPISSLVYSGNERNISSVFVEGQLVLEAGQITRVDEPALIDRASQKAKALYESAHSR